MSQAEKILSFVERLDAAHLKRKAVEKEISAVYTEASHCIDVHALKAAMSCRYGCESGDELVSIYNLFRRYLLPNERNRERAERQRIAPDRFRDPSKVHPYDALACPGHLYENPGGLSRRGFSFVPRSADRGHG
jgi:uncharacterized protein (UPF0335 family)